MASSDINILYRAYRIGSDKNTFSGYEKFVADGYDVTQRYEGKSFFSDVKTALYRMYYPSPRVTVFIMKLLSLNYPLKGDPIAEADGHEIFNFMLWSKSLDELTQLVPYLPNFPETVIFNVFSEKPEWLPFFLTHGMSLNVVNHDGIDPVTFALNIKKKK
jgi:hypothetical protein